jgi:hypothetical protein
MDHPAGQRVYEPPAIVELGRVHVLTQAHHKKHGPSDGFTFAGHPITNAS